MRFQPTCGTTSSLLNLRTFPFNKPNPGVDPNSSDSSNSNFMPTQTPSNGVPSRTLSPTSRSNPRSFNAFMQAPNAPTPGNTNRSAARNSASSPVTIASQPVAANAFSTERRLPTP